MNPRGHRGFGILVLLVLLLSGLAVLPTHALGQNQIVGLVSQCASSTYLSGATVTLTDANGVQNPRTTTTAGDGTFSFSPPAGYYGLTVTKTGYFASSPTTPVRFDGSVTVTQNLCLDPTPTVDRTLSLLVVSQASVFHADEVVNFPRTFVSNENAAPTWDAASNTVTLLNRPLSSVSIGIRYERFDQTYSKTFGPSDYTVTDYWNSTIEVIDATTVADLDVNPARGALKVSYFYWQPAQRLAFSPLLEASYTAKKNAVSWMAAEDVDWRIDIDTGLVEILGNFVNGTDMLTFDYSSVTAVSGASIDLYWAPEGQVVNTVSTDSAGQTTLSLWTGTFELRTSRAGYEPNVTSVDTSSVTKMRVRMLTGVVLIGHAKDTEGRFIATGLQGFLYNTDPAANPGRKLIAPSVVGSLFTFNAPAGTYRMIMDANGYRASATTVTLSSGTVVQDVTLPVADPEEYRTSVVYGRADWNNLTIYRNLTLNPDSTLATLNPAGLRDLRLQIDYTFGDRNGLLDGIEPAAFEAWLLNNGPVYTTSDGFLTTNSRSYNSSASSYAVTVQGLTTPGSKVWINTSATYTIKGTPYLAYGAQRYFVNVTVRDDSNTSEYQDQVYTIVLPRAYEMTGNPTITNPPVTVSGFTRVTLDPGIPPSGQTSQVRMVAQQSLNGTANAKVVLPAGKFYVVNASFTNYQAFVAKDTNLTFSAEDSRDPIGDIAKANFTWHFLANDTVEGNLPANIGYGIRTYYTYRKAGEFVVNLTVTQAGGNKTYRDVKVWVDGEAPIARIKTNRTGSGSINGTELRVDEKSPIRFDAGLSTDLAYLGKNGLVLDPSGYSWDFNGDRITDSTGKIVNYSYPKPGRFTVNLTVTDSVGLKSVNATITVIANDTTAPTVAFDIRDPSNDYAIVTTLTENRMYSLNASRTTDNYDAATALNYSWSIPGPILGRIGRGPHPFYGMNISFTWTEFNTSYNVILNVTDSGFDGRKGNTGNVTRGVTVQVDWAVRPDLKIDSGTLEVTPSDPEDATTITVTVNVTNKDNRGAAGNVTAQLLSISGGVTTVLSSTPEWRNRSGPKLDRTIASGETVTLVFTATVSGQGNKTIQVYVYDAREPYTAITGENRASTPVNVRQAAWVQYAIYGSIVGVLAVFVFYAYYRRKVRAGEWQPLRRRGEKRAEGAEKKARKEVKEEKKRL